MAVHRLRPVAPVPAREEILVDGLFSASRAIRHRLRPELERERLTGPMFWALNQLVLEGPRNVGALAGACAVTPAGVSAAAHALESAGLVARSYGKADRRVVVLTATPRGVAVHRAIWRRLAEGMVPSLEGIPVRELETTVRVLGRLAGLAEPSASHPLLVEAP